MSKQEITGEKHKQNIGLILEGEGMRGVYTTGVLDAFIESGIEFDSCICFSASANHGASFMPKQFQREKRVNMNYLDNWRFCGLRSFLVTGDYFGSDMLYRIIPDELEFYGKEALIRQKAGFVSL